MPIRDEEERLNQKEHTMHREIVGSLMYLAVSTQPDLAFSVNKLRGRCKLRLIEICETQIGRCVTSVALRISACSTRNSDAFHTNLSSLPLRQTEAELRGMDRRLQDSWSSSTGHRYTGAPNVRPSSHCIPAKQNTLPCMPAHGIHYSCESSSRK